MPLRDEMNTKTRNMKFSENVIELAYAEGIGIHMSVQIRRQISRHDIHMGSYSVG